MGNGGLARIVVFRENSNGVGTLLLISSVIQCLVGGVQYFTQLFLIVKSDIPLNSSTVI